VNESTIVEIRYKPQSTLISAAELALLESILPDLILAMQAEEQEQ
jgi:hypothetical protein